MKLLVEVKHINYQRNGVSGNGFHVVQFKSRERGEPDRDMVAVVFPEHSNIAVLDLADLTSCWRGDVFEDDLRKAVEEFQDAEWAKTKAYAESLKPLTNKI